MEQTGLSFLYCLASLAMAFIAFSIIVIIFRQMIGAGLTEFQLLLFKLFIGNGFSVIAIALLPPLLNLFDLHELLLWRIASLITLVYMATYQLLYIYNRRKVKQGPLASWIYVIRTITISIFVLLFFNVLGWPFEPGVPVYALGVFWALIQLFIIFYQSLGVFFERS
jgi:hypothetical protein